MADTDFDPRIVVSSDLRIITTGWLPGIVGPDQFFYAIRADGRACGFLDDDAYVAFVAERKSGAAYFGKPQILAHDFSKKPPERIVDSHPLMNDITWNGSTLWPEIHVFKPEPGSPLTKVGVSVLLGDFDPAMTTTNRHERVDIKPILVDGYPDRCWVNVTHTYHGTMAQIRELFTQRLAAHDRIIGATLLSDADQAKYEVQPPGSIPEGRALDFYEPGKVGQRAGLSAPNGP